MRRTLSGMSLMMALNVCACAASPSPPPAASPNAAPAARSPFEPMAARSSPPPFEAVVDPANMPVVEINDEIETIVTTSSDELVAYVDKHMSPARLDSGTVESLSAPLPPGRTTFTIVQPAQTASVAFVQRQAQDGRAIVLTRSAQGFLIPPVAWVGTVLALRGIAPTDASVWYRALIQRLAATGAASGIALFANGNAMAVVLDLRAGKSTANDVQLVAQTKFFRAGEYSADAWGPKITGADGVSATKMNGHEGISVSDVLRKLPRTAPATPTGITL